MLCDTLGVLAPEADRSLRAHHARELRPAARFSRSQRLRPGGAELDCRAALRCRARARHGQRNRRARRQHQPGDPGGDGARSVRHEQQCQRALARHAQRSGGRNQRHRSRRPTLRWSAASAPSRAAACMPTATKRESSIRTGSIRAALDASAATTSARPRESPPSSTTAKSLESRSARAAAHVARQGERAGRRQSHASPRPTSFSFCTRSSEKKRMA